MKNCSKLKAIVVFVSLALLVLPSVSAFANTFLEDKTMHLWKGETGKYCVYLQNTGDEDLVQIIKIFEGEEYIKNIDEIKKEFNVSVGTVSDDLPVCMELRLPRNSEKGEKYPISYGVTGPSSNNEGGLVSLAPIQIREKFYLTEKLDKKPVSLVTYAILIFVGIAVIGTIFGYRYRKKRMKAQEVENEVT